VETAMEHLLGEVAAELLEAGRGAVRLECCIRCISGEPVGVSVGLFEPTVSAGHLFGVLRMPFERLRLPGPVTAIRVAATATAPLEPRQGTLFAGEEPAGQPRDVALLVDRLIGRLGRHAVVGVRLVPDAQPEFGWHREVLASDSRRRRRKKPAAELPPRPIRLLPRPIALQASSSAPGDTEGGQSHFCGLLPQKSGQSPEHFPRQFRLNNRQHVVAGGWGPERIETGWWRGQTIGRDYYQVETTTGRRFWLFRRLRDGRWFLHGIFE
jgi:protein ImuB